MTYKELIEGLFDVVIKDETTLCDLIYVTECQDMLCEECVKNKKLSEVDVDFGELYANILTNKELRAFFYKNLLNAYYGKSIYVDTDSISYMNPPQDPWIEVHAKVLNGNLTYNIAEILDDATVHGLDFKYENGKYYYKERTCP